MMTADVLRTPAFDSSLNCITPEFDEQIIDEQITRAREDIRMGRITPVNAETSAQFIASLRN